jgi:aspartyl-tRNA(Asn)/glutamyl-tRNA(Gln) amidotransferase subunit A
MFDKTVAELSQALENREFSSVELTQACLDRIERHRDLNAFITVDRDRTLAEAKAADARRARGEATVLTGIPIAQKDIFCADGWPTTCGSKMLANFTAPYDATVIERFKAAGAVMLGKTNMDEFAMGSSNETSFFGPVRNPWDPTRCRAAAPAAPPPRWPRGWRRPRPAPTPAARSASRRRCAGITGLKPTYGRVSRYGMIAFASSLDQGGPMTRSPRMRAAARRHGRFRPARLDQRRCAGAGLRSDLEPTSGA